MPAPLQPPEISIRLVLQHPVFSSFGDVRFRRAEPDGLPVLAIRLGEREAQLPLDALQREFGIADDSDDGRMLALIAAALEYVPSLQAGDRLPSEVLTGKASWRPSPDHLLLATTRLQLNLLAWLAPQSRWAATKRDDVTLLRLAGGAALSRDVQAAASAAAQLLGLRDAAHVIGLIADLSDELSYIEALRQRLLARVEALCRRVAILRVQRRIGAAADTLSQVHRLSLMAFQQIRTRFDDVDAVTCVFDTLGRNTESLRGFIRSTRDWLYQSQRAWEPLLARWDRTAKAESGLLASTYRFLAPRFMPTTQWQGQQATSAPPKTRAGPPRAQMAW